MSDVLPSAFDSSTEAPETREARGVANPRIVDLMHLDRSSGEVVLTLLEWRPWGGEDHLLQLDEKLSNYFVYVVDGFLVRDYPTYLGAPVRVQLDTVHPAPAAVVAILEEAGRVGAEHGIRVALRHVAAEDLAVASWEDSE